MKYLLDTSILLWYTNADAQLPKDIIELIEDRENQILVSTISFMELIIKRKNGKLPEFKPNMEEFHKSLEDLDIEIIPIDSKVLKVFESSTFNEDHKDPFDRFILSSGKATDSSIISSDGKFKGYGSEFDVLFVNKLP